MEYWNGRFTFQEDLEKIENCPIYILFGPPEFYFFCLLYQKERAEAEELLQFLLDAFLTHNWGDHHEIHKLVARVNELLKAAGLKTWFDEEKMKGNVQKQMQKGIDKSASVIVFITQQYIAKVDSDNISDNCQLEFTYAALQKHKRPLIPVLLDPAASNPADWVGPVAFHLSGELYIDLSTEDKLQRNIGQLIDRIKEVTNKDPSGRVSPPRRQLHPQPERTQSDSARKQAVATDNMELDAEQVKKKDAKLTRLTTKVKDIVDVVLANPRTPLKPEEKLDVLAGCVNMGSVEAQKAQGKSVCIVIGNTGAGKSTLANFVFGCTMEQFKLEGKKKKKAYRVRHDSPKPEVMPIGHTNQSMTFVPGVVTDDELGITILDCPGFLDNRGAVINIANAVNIKQSIHAAKDVVVIVVLNYFTFKADRGRGLRELVQILQDLFGEGSYDDVGGVTYILYTYSCK